jgi:hypothetical protein
MNVSRAASALSIAVLVFCLKPISAQIAGYYPKGGPDTGAEEVSLVQLIATPERYDGKTVRLIGYLHLEFEGDAIYFHHEDFVDGITKNAVWIDLPKDISPSETKAVNDHYVICTAKFVAGRHGHMGLFAGELEDVTRLEIWDIAPDGKGVPPPPPPPSRPK